MLRLTGDLFSLRVLLGDKRIWGGAMDSGCIALPGLSKLGRGGAAYSRVGGDRPIGLIVGRFLRLGEAVIMSSTFSSPGKVIPSSRSCATDGQ